MSWEFTPVETVDSHTNDPTPFLNAGVTSYEKKDYGRALELIRHAIKLARKREDDELVAIGHIYEIVIIRARGDNAKAETLEKRYDNQYLRDCLNKYPALGNLFGQSPLQQQTPPPPVQIPVPPPPAPAPVQQAAPAIVQPPIPSTENVVVQDSPKPQSSSKKSLYIAAAGIILVAVGAFAFGSNLAKQSADKPTASKPPVAAEKSTAPAAAASQSKPTLSQNASEPAKKSESSAAPPAMKASAKAETKIQPKPETAPPANKSEDRAAEQATTSPAQQPAEPPPAQQTTEADPAPQPAAAPAPQAPADDGNNG